MNNKQIFSSCCLIVYLYGVYRTETPHRWPDFDKFGVVVLIFSIIFVNSAIGRSPFKVMCVANNYVISPKYIYTIFSETNIYGRFIHRLHCTSYSTNTVNIKDVSIERRLKGEIMCEFSDKIDFTSELSFNTSS